MFSTRGTYAVRDESKVVDIIWFNQKEERYVKSSLRAMNREEVRGCPSTTSLLKGSVNGLLIMTVESTEYAVDCMQDLSSLVCQRLGLWEAYRGILLP